MGQSAAGHEISIFPGLGAYYDGSPLVRRGNWSPMAKAPNKSTAAIQRLLEERRQYEAWIARIDAAGGAAPSTVRTRVRSDYEARLNAVTEELKVHAEAARLMAAQRREVRRDLQGKETTAAERLAEAELRHAVGEYDESQWTQVHKESLAELVSVREELGAVEEDIAQLEELERLVKLRPATAAPTPAPAPPPPAPPPPPAVPAGTNTGTMPRVGPPPRPQAPVPAPAAAKDGQKNDAKAPEKPAMIDELAFLKSVTDDDKRGIGSPGPTPTIRRSGAQFQPAEPAPARPTSTPASTTPAPTPVAATPASEDPEPVRTLKCRECGTMNLPTEWYCESCGAELAAL